METQKSISDQVRIVCKKLLPAFSVATFFASLIVVATSAIKAYLYSDYFGIHIDNFDYLSTAREMLICIGPCILLFLTYELFFYIYLNNLFVLSVFGNFVWLFDLIIFSSVSTYLIIFNDISYNLKKNMLLIIVLINIPIILLVIYNTYFEKVICTKRMKKYGSKSIKSIKEDHSNLNDWVKFFVRCLLAALLALYLWGNIADRCDPGMLKNYEIASNDDKCYAVICNYNNKKIAMTCNISDDNKIYVYYGSYVYIDPEEYTFRYLSFDEAYRVLNEN